MLAPHPAVPLKLKHSGAMSQLMLAWALSLVSACVASRSDSRLSSDAAEVTRDPKSSLMAAMALFDGAGQLPPRTLATELQKHAATSPPGPLQEALRRAGNLAKRIDQAPLALGIQDRQEALAIMGLMQQIYAKDFATRLAISTAITRMEMNLGGSVHELGGEANGAESHQRQLARALGLVKDFPLEARAYEYLGQVHTEGGLDPLSALRAYRRCLELSPRQESCQGAHDRLSKEYQAPRCLGLRDDKFYVYAAHKTPGPKTQSLSIGDLRLHASGKPVMTGRAVRELTASENRKAGSTKGSRMHRWSIDLTPQGAAVLAEQSQRLAETAGYLVISVEQRVVHAALVLSPLDTSQLQINVEHAPDWPRLCSKLERRALPQDLRRGAP